MDEFKINNVGDIIIAKTELIVANHRDAKPFWDFLEDNSVLDWEKIVIDVSSCHYIDSAFIGVIVKAFREISANNGELKLAFPQREGVESMKYLGITKIIECFNTLKEALDSFNSQLPTRDLTFDEGPSLNWCFLLIYLSQNINKAIIDTKKLVRAYPPSMKVGGGFC